MPSYRQASISQIAAAPPSSKHTGFKLRFGMDDGVVSRSRTLARCPDAVTGRGSRADSCNTLSPADSGHREGVESRE